MTIDERKAWVETLKVGSTVAIESRGDYFIATVRDMSHGCPTVNGLKYDRKGCVHTGDVWHGAYYELFPVTEEIKKKVISRRRAEEQVREREMLTTRINTSLEAKTLPVEVLREIDAIVTKYEATASTNTRKE